MPLKEVSLSLFSFYSLSVCACVRKQERGNKREMISGHVLGVLLNKSKKTIFSELCHKFSPMQSFTCHIHERDALSGPGHQYTGIKSVAVHLFIDYYHHFSRDPPIPPWPPRYQRQLAVVIHGQGEVVFARKRADVREKDNVISAKCASTSGCLARRHA